MQDLAPQTESRDKMQVGICELLALYSCIQIFRGEINGKK
jgi:hypothetical protein